MTLSSSTGASRPRVPVSSGERVCVLFRLRARRALRARCREYLGWVYRRRRHLGVARRGVELGMPERTRAIVRSFYVIEIKRSAERDAMLANGMPRSLAVSKDKYS